MTGQELRQLYTVLLVTMSILSTMVGCVASVGSIDVDIALKTCHQPLSEVNSCLEDTRGDQNRCAPFIQSFQTCLSANGTRATASNVTDDVLEALREKAQTCYEQRDPACLKAVYSLIAVGGFLKGLPVASKNMTNFLYVGKSPLVIDSNALRADPAVEHQLEAARRKVELIAGQQIKAKNKGPTQHDLFHGAVYGQSKDIYYGLGSFTLIVVTSGG